MSVSRWEVVLKLEYNEDVERLNSMISYGVTEGLALNELLCFLINKFSKLT